MKHCERMREIKEMISMEKRSNSSLLHVPLNLALVFRGDAGSIEAFLREVEEILQRYPNIRIAHRHASAGKRWVSEVER